MQLLRNGLTAAALATLLVPVALDAQVREVRSKQVAVGRSEASLRLEFVDGGTLDVSFEDGVVSVDGERVGGFERGDDLDAAWRSLLGQAVALDDGPLAAALADWTVPAELAGELADVARRIDRSIEEALRPAQITVEAGDASISVSSDGAGSSLLRMLLSGDRLSLIEAALAGLGSEVRVHLQEDVRVAEGEVVRGTLVALGGDVVVAGEVDGNVVVVGGRLDLLPGSHVSGEVRLADATLGRNEGDVDGDVVEVDADDRDREAVIRNRIRDEIRSELRHELGNERGRADRGNGGFSLMAPFESVFRGVGGLLENLVGIFVLGLIGAAVVAFASENMDAVAETARRSPARAMTVGLAGTILLVPVWVLGAIALAVSIIGIPVMIAWLPLFPLAACAAAVMGYLAVARNAGEWLAESDLPWTGWIRPSNPIVAIFGGLVALMLAFMAANVVSIAPFLGFLSVLLAFAGVVVTFVAVQIGFGAVILTRGGRRREYWSTSYDADAAWEAAIDLDLDAEPGAARPGAPRPEAKPDDVSSPGGRTASAGPSNGPAASAEGAGGGEERGESDHGDGAPDA